MSFFLKDKQCDKASCSIAHHFTFSLYQIICDIHKLHLWQTSENIKKKSLTNYENMKNDKYEIIAIQNHKYTVTAMKNDKYTITAVKLDK